MNRILQLGWLAGPYGAALVTLMVAGAGVLLRRRMPGLGAGTGALAAMAGFGVLAPGVRGWVDPSGASAALVGAAGVLTCAGLVQGGLQRQGVWTRRWVGIVGLVGASWWVAEAAGGEIWRAVAGMVAVGVVTARRGSLGIAGGLALWGGLAMAGVGMPWPAVGVVLAAAAAGGAVLGLAGIAGVLAVGIGAVELGAGRLGRGRFGVVDAVCCLAVCAPFLAGWIEHAVAGRLGPSRRPWLARFAGIVGAGLAGVGAAWMWVRVGRG